VYVGLENKLCLNVIVNLKTVSVLWVISEDEINNNEEQLRKAAQIRILSKGMTRLDVLVVAVINIKGGFDSNCCDRR
jgi:hypothetical protein